MTERLRDLPPEKLDPGEREAVQVLRRLAPLRPSPESARRIWRGLEARARARRPRRTLARAGLALGLGSALALAALGVRGLRSPPPSPAVPAAEAPGEPAAVAEVRPAAPPPRRLPAPAPVRLPSVEDLPLAGGAVLWSTGFESGDRSDWRHGPIRPKPGFFEGAGTRQEVVTEPVRSGRFAVKLAIDAPAGSSRKVSYLSRDGVLPDEAYYEAWYYFPELHEAPSYWTIMSFRGRQDPADARTRVDNLWNLNVQNRADGEMALSLWDGLRRRHHRQEAPLAIPVGRWVHVEVFFKRDSGPGGRIVVWQDGTKLFDLRDVVTAPSAWLSWMVCSVGRGVTPAPAVVYVDDVAVIASAAPPP